MGIREALTRRRKPHAVGRWLVVAWVGLLLLVSLIDMAVQLKPHALRLWGRIEPYITSDLTISIAYVVLFAVILWLLVRRGSRSASPPPSSH